jgi:hypothetical protein
MGPRREVPTLKLQREIVQARRHLARTNLRLDAMMMKMMKEQRAADRRVKKPDLRSVLRLSRDIAQLPARHRIGAGQARLYLKYVYRLVRRQARLEDLVARMETRERSRRWQMQWERSIGLLLRRGDKDALLNELLGDRNVQGKNLYAVALARLGRRQRSREEYAELGRKGATIRWARWRERRGPQPSGGKPMMSEPAPGNGTVLIAGASGLEQSGECSVDTAPTPTPGR